MKFPHNIKKLEYSILEEFLHQNMFVLLEFGTEWCYYCGLQHALLEKNQAKLKKWFPTLEVAEIDGDECEDLCQELDIDAFPALVLWYQDQFLKFEAGYTEIKEIRQTIKMVIETDVNHTMDREIKTPTIHLQNNEQLEIQSFSVKVDPKNCAFHFEPAMHNGTQGYRLMKNGILFQNSWKPRPSEIDFTQDIQNYSGDMAQLQQIIAADTIFVEHADDELAAFIIQLFGFWR